MTYSCSSSSNFIYNMNHYLLIDCNILQKQSCPSVTFIKEKFCLKFLCDHSALNILESHNYLWYYPVLELWRTGKTFPLPDQKHLQFDLVLAVHLQKNELLLYCHDHMHFEAKPTKACSSISFDRELISLENLK